MSAQALNGELERYLAMPSDERWKWLARLLFALTQFARGTYTIGETGLQYPEKLRLYNELLHRIAGQLRDKAASHLGMPDDVFVKVLAESIPSLDIDTSALVDMLK
jgi:hypothetical protein